MSTTVQQDLPAATWGLDANHSTAGFAIKYMAGTFRAGFEKFDVTLDTTGDQPRVTGSVAPESITVKDENFHAHLQAPDFFDTERHPAITFESTGWRVDGDELIVDGNLTIKGDTRPVEARGTLNGPDEDPWGNTRVGVTLEASLDRTHFGLTWNNPLPKGGLALANDVRLHVDLQLVKA
ncbi:MAG TPA: YceI family protein [Solirubrobacteraceae bacterium]|nr:YceI family protein [Solirubrobacteraceae bacterium]